jgi:putative methionine-R-sulfoxide reductase with GAF domain
MDADEDFGEVERLRRERDAYARAVGDLQGRFDEKVEELSLVRQVGDALGESLDLGTVCRRAVDLIHENLSPENCSVMLVMASGLVLGAGKGAYDDAPTVIEVAAEHPRFALGEGIAGVVAATRKVIRLDDASADPRFVARPESHRGAHEPALPALDRARSGRRRDQPLGLAPGRLRAEARARAGHHRQFRRHGRGERAPLLRDQPQPRSARP